MDRHPLSDLAVSRDVKQAKGFRTVAQGLTGESLNLQYKQEVENAPRRSSVDKKYFVPHPRVPTGRRNGKDIEHLAMALLGHCSSAGQLELPEGGALTLIDHHVPLATAAVDKSLGDEDPNKGVGAIDLLGMLADDRLAVVALRHVAPSATRGRTGDTPLRALLEGLAAAAIVEANRDDIALEVLAATDRTVSTEPPALVLMGSAR